MRTLFLVPVAVVLALAGTAHADSLWDAELRLGYGFEVASGAGMTIPHSAPLTLEGIAAFAIQDDPRLYAYGGFLVETLDRSSLGGTGGIQLVQGPVRLRVGADVVFAPYTLWGANASGGMCRRLSPGIRGCADLALTEFFTGTDLPKGHSETQVQLVFGVVFDGT